MKRITAVTLALFASVAFAEPPDFIPPGHQYGGQGGQGGNAQQGQLQGQAQGQLQGQAQGQLQGQGQAQIGINKNLIGNGVGNFSPKAYGGKAYSNSDANAKAYSGSKSKAYSGGNSQSMTYNEAEIPVNTSQEIKYSGSYELKNVPNVYAPNIYPSSPCMGSSSAGGSGVGFGLSFGTSWVDEECQKMEASRNAPTPADKIFIWCQSKFAANSPSCAKLAPAKTADARSERARDGDDRTRTIVSLAGPAVVSPDGRQWAQDSYGQWVERP